MFHVYPDEYFLRSDLIYCSKISMSYDGTILIRATLKLVCIQMGHEAVDNHNLGKHIKDYISGHKNSNQILPKTFW